MSSEEVVVNVDYGVRSCEMFCNWCTQTWTYTERGEHSHDFVTCPWCKSRLKVPRVKMRRINGHRR